MPEYRSRTTTHGRNMAGARSLWRATGMKDADFVNKTFAWLKSTYENVIEKALELAKRNIGSVGRDPETGNAIDPSDSRAMEVISIEYINTPANNVLDEKVEQEYIVEE